LFYFYLLLIDHYLGESNVQVFNYWINSTIWVIIYL